MKILKFSLFYLLLISHILSCQNDDSDIHSKKTYILGKVKNKEVYPKRKFFTLTIKDFRAKETVLKAPIKEDGSFYFEFDLYKTQDIKVEPLIGRVIASPGDSIGIYIDFKDIAEVKFFKDKKKVNADLYRYLNSYYSVFNYRNRETRKMNFVQYKKHCDQEKEKAEQNRTDFIKERNPSNEIKDWTRAHVNIKHQQAMYHFALMTIRGKMEGNQMEVPENYYDFVQEIGKTCSELIVNTDVDRVLDKYIFNLHLNIKKNLNLDTSNYFPNFIDTIKQKHPNSHLADMLITHMFNKKLNHNELNFFKEHQQKLNTSVKDKKLKAQLHRFYSNQLEHSKNPEKKTKTLLSKIKDTDAELLIEQIWRRNKGKVMYIDFWASWCAPCRDEMYNTMDLMKKMQGEKIAFVDICMFSKEEQWKELMLKFQLKGQHYFCQDEQARYIREKFRLKRFPTYMLVDKQGNIVEYGSNLRPLAKSTINKIQKLLKDDLAIEKE
jgi:thiol-disulfide isomerase/thioredoxin